ncbi:MAG: hypothetical protein K8R38_01655, partial [Verrucomicrobia bacterium]|nr:hypothetical protein [Verrucomicrobiota bacterium]
MFHPPSNPKTLGRLILLALLFCAQGILLAEESSESSGAAQEGQDGVAPSDSSFQVAPPSVTVPTPALPLPPPLQESTPEQQGHQEQPKPEARPRAEFNPPSA